MDIQTNLTIQKKAIGIEFKALHIVKHENGTQAFIQFQINNGGANCGKITANGANTAAFGSTSDRRAKENIADIASITNNNNHDSCD